MTDYSLHLNVGQSDIAKLFSRVSVGWNGITMPMTSGTVSSANLHIGLGLCIRHNLNDQGQFSMNNMNI